jgi:enediyne polyketide synthase
LTTPDLSTPDLSTIEDILALVRRLVAERAELPPDAIGDDDRLLSDLHLNSITVSQVVAEATRRLKLAPPVAPIEYANVTVATVAQALLEIAHNGEATPADQERRSVPGVDAWVRTFTVELVERPLPRRELVTGPGHWNVIASPEHPLAASLHQAFSGAAGRGVVVCLPPQPDERHLKLLLEGVRALFALEKGACFVLVQHGRGAAALARTLHLEAPEHTTCVVSVPVDHPAAAVWVLAEAMAAAGYVEAHYDDAGRRYEPVLRLLPLEDDKMTKWQGDKVTTESPPHPVTLSSLPLGPEDVLLVTGGGKGITAECALFLARSSGARLALVGRSQPETDADLAVNLERMRVSGVDFRYLVADVTQAAEVQAVVQEVERTLGPVTAILHGAARNAPQLLRSLDEEAFRQTFAPKLQGATNLLAAINPQQLRFFVTFGSIIARTGLAGEADYGLANEWLVALTEQFQRSHPTCRCLAVEWSVWSGAGMGDRLGRLEALTRQGITPIPVDEGVAMLHRLLACLGQDSISSLPTSVVVTGRFGSGPMGAPTLRIEQPELPFWRFLEQVRVYYPGVELVVDATLSTHSDPYLDDHVFRGERLLPAVIGLEAMAQVAMALLATTGPPLFEDVQFERPVVVPEGKSLLIRLAALARGSGPDGSWVEVVLRSEETAFQVNHFRAICRFGKPCTEDSSSGRHPEFSPVDLEPQRDLYGRLLFHRVRFRRLKSYHQVAARACIAEIAENEAAWFARYLPPDLLLGDPGMRDAVIHALQVCVPQATLLPIGVEQLMVNASTASGSCFVHAQERSHEGNTYIYDVDVTDAAGRIQEHWQGLRLRAVGGAAFTGPWPAPLLGPYLERQLGEIAPEIDMRVAVECSAHLHRRGRSDLAIQRALGEVVPILRRPDGKPEVAGGWWLVADEPSSAIRAPQGVPSATRFAVSAAHTGDLTLAVAGRPLAPRGSPPLGTALVGCDVEPVVARPQAVWQDLLAQERFSLAATVAREAREEINTAATRLWAAGECLKKAGAALCAPLILTSIHAEGWVLLSAGALRVATLVAQVQDIQEPLVLAVAFGIRD